MQGSILAYSNTKKIPHCAIFFKFLDILHYQGVRKQIFYGGAQLNRKKNILENLLIFEIFTK